MKKSVAVVVLLSALSSVFLSTPAQAVFGLSQCEKVKKFVLKQESDFNSASTRVNAFVGRTFASGSALSAYNNFLSKDKNLFEIWRSIYNNQKCFTRTQRDYGKTLKDVKVLGTFLIVDRREIYKQTKYCKSIDGLFSDNCYYTDDDVIQTVYSLKSTYEY